VAERYRRDYGVDVLTAPGTGAAGGFGGALVALGGSLRSGYAVVTETLGFAEALRTSGVVVTGEGSFDATSLLGKVVGSVVGDGSALGVPVLIIAGRADDDAVREAEAAGAHVVSLTARFGEERAMADTAACIAHAVGEGLAVVAPAGPGSGRSPVDGP
jgi:glycerate kinase